MRGEDEMGFPFAPQGRQGRHVPQTRKEIKRWREIEEAQLKRAERKAIEVLTVSRWVDLVFRVVLLTITVTIGLAVVVGTQGHPKLLGWSLGVAGAWSAILLAASRLLRSTSGHKS
jgi:hypothetical protein